MYFQAHSKLEDNLKSYITKADNVLVGVDWMHMDKNELCFTCCKEKDLGNESKYDAYLSALIVRYWGLIDTNYSIGKGAYGCGDCYNWLLDSILGTIESKSWLNPNSSLFNDPLAPDKSINVRMKSHRQGFYQWSNCKKRANDFILNNSFERLFEVAGDSAFPCIEDAGSNKIDDELDVSNIIANEFNNKNYVYSFVLHSIMSGDAFDLVKNNKGEKHYEFSKKRVYSTLWNIDDEFKNSFQYMYKVSREDIDVATDICSKLSRHRMHTLVDDSMNKLSKKFKYLKNK